MVVFIGGNYGKIELALPSVTNKKSISLSYVLRSTSDDAPSGSRCLRATHLK